MAKQSEFSTHCHLCGLEVTIPELDQHQCANCPRCHHHLSHYHANSPDKTLAFGLSALVFLFLSLPYKFLAFSANGQQREIDLPGGLQTLTQLDYYSLTMITAIATLVIPGAVLSGVITLSYCRVFALKPAWLVNIHKTVRALIPWSMAEIFLVGTLVSLIKIADMATINIGMSFTAFCLFIGCMTCSIYYYDPIAYAKWLDIPAHKTANVSQDEKTKSIQRTWALLITACILYIPANVYPIMHTEFFGNIEPSTILGGVITLWQSGSYPIAAIIFLASVVIPIAKLIVLAWLNWSVQRRSAKMRSHRSLMYKITEWIGRWSMIDVFVVAILVALVQLGSTISIYPGFAAIAFCTVVFFTMLAAMTFDARLIWHKDD